MIVNSNNNNLHDGGGFIKNISRNNKDNYSISISYKIIILYFI